MKPIIAVGAVNKIIQEAMSTEPNCPCANWARDIDLKYLTNHHPNCPRYNDSLMDVWKVTVDGVSCFVEHEQDAQDTVGDCGTITKEQMHREVFEHLPEFRGF